MNARANAIVSGGLLTQQVATFLLNVFLARSLGVAGFGELGILKNLSTFVLILTPLGLDLALLKHGSLYRKSPGQLRLISTSFRTLVGMVNVGLVLLVAVWIGPRLQIIYPSPNFSQLATLTMLGVTFAADIQLSGALFRVDNQFVIYAYLASYGQSVVRLLLSIAVVLGGGNVLAIVWVNSGCFAATMLSLEFFSKGRSHPFEPLAGFGLSRRMAAILSESLWMALSLLSYQAMRFVDVLILGALTTVKLTGEYSAVSGVCQVIQIYPAAISQALGPTIASLYEQRRLADISLELTRYVRTASLIGGYMFAGIAVFGSDLDLVFGSAFQFSWKLTLLLASGWYISATLSPFGYVLSMTGRHRIEMVILLGGSFVLVALLYLLIPPFGSLGAAAAVMLAFLAVNTVRSLYVIQILNSSPLRFEALAPPLFFLVSAAVTHATGAALWSRNLFDLIALCIVYSILAALGYVTLFAEKSELRWIFARARTLSARS